MQEAKNKAIVAAALQIAFSRGAPMEERRAKLAGFINPEKYIQHSAVVPDGFEGLLSLIEAIDRDNDDYEVSIKRMIAEDDLVVAHCHYRFGSADRLGKAIVEIFRVEDDRLVEHWDVIQDVPAEPANQNGMF